MLYTIHRYPTEWIDRWTVHDGSIATVRPILPQDAPFEAALIEGLSSRSRCVRFPVGSGRLTDKILAAHTRIDYVNHMTLVVSVTHPDGIGEDLVADGRFVVEDDVAEFAMLVADTWQDKGVGRRLLATLMRTTRMSGAREVFDEVSSINRRMISLARDTNFRVASMPGDTTVCAVRLPLAQTEMAVVPFAFAWYSSSRACTRCRYAYRVSLSPSLGDFFLV